MPGGFELLRSLTKSSEEPVETHIKGGVPEWLNGILFRNGPGRYEYGDKAYKHLFDGHSCLHKFKIENGKVFYSNKFLETKSYTKSLKENRLYPVFGTADVCSNVFGRFKTFFYPPNTMDNVNVNVVPFAHEHLYALTETNLICRIDPKDLSIMSTVNVKDFIPTATTTIAHPHVENNGSWIIVGMNTKGKVPHYEFIRYDGTGKAAKLNNLCENGEIIASIPSNHSFGLSYFHSFGITKNYIVFLEQSLVFNFKNFFAGLVTNKAFSDSLIMNPNWRTRIHLINRQTGEVIKQKFSTEPLFLFHHINAYEKPDPKDPNSIQIIVDVCAYNPKYFKINEFTYENMFTNKLLGTELVKSTAKRIIVPFKPNSDEEEDEIFCQLKDLNPNVSFELPTINYTSYNGLPYKYMYGVNYYKKPFSIVKINMENPSEVLETPYCDGQNFLPSEPIFVPSPRHQSEDDGVILVMVLADINDFLSVLDAKTLKEIARAHIPEDIKAAFTFHGFYADSRLYRRLNA